MEDMTILKQRKPNVAQFLESWIARNEKRSFDFSKEEDQADFYEALQDMGRHIAHVSQSATLSSIISVDGVNTLYVNVTPSHDTD